MKKRISSILLVLLLLALTMSNALAVSVSYENGTVNVSGSYSERYFVYLDGRSTGMFLGQSHTSAAIKANLKEGEHTISIVDFYTGAEVDCATFYVGTAPTATPRPTATPVPTAEPTATPEPTAEPTVTPDVDPSLPMVLNSASYENGVLTFNVSNLVGNAEIWIDGKAASYTCRGSGTHSISCKLTAGPHEIMLFDSRDGDMTSMTFEVSSPSISAVCEAANTVTYTIRNLNTRSEIWLDDRSTGITAASNGTFTMSAKLEEGTHTILLFNSLTNEMVSDTFVVGHVFEILPAVEATCTESGLTEGKRCTVCGEVFTEQEVIDALGHTEVIDEAAEATCTETGITEGVHCSVCDTVIVAQEIVPAVGHSEVIDEAVEATCTESGLTEGTHCAVCGEVLKVQEYVPAKGHVVAVDAEGTPTCTETGLTEGSHCIVCGEVISAQEAISAVGHATNDWVYGVYGAHILECARCGLIVGLVDCYNRAVCPVCGNIEDAEEAGKIFGVEMNGFDGKILKRIYTATIRQSAKAVSGEAVVRIIEINDSTSIMTVCLSRDGVCAIAYDAVKVSVPAELIRNCKLTSIVECVVDGVVTYVENEVEVTENGNMAMFDIDYSNTGACFIRIDK